MQSEVALFALIYGEGFERAQPEQAATALRALTTSSLPLSLPLALAQGDLTRVQALLPPAQVKQPIAPWLAEPLAYAAASSLARLPAFRAGLIATVQWLLAQGADPNARWQPGANGDSLPLLYGAVAMANCLETTELLLQAGADPNDQESLYHATEQADRRLLEALVRAGARWPRTNALFRQLDFEEPEHLRQALALGADANELAAGGLRPLQHALRCGRSLACVNLLMAQGADPALADAQGRNTAWHAQHWGETELLTCLAAQGVLPEPAGIDAFLFACAAADETSARRLLAEAPKRVQDLPEAALRLLPDQAQRGRLASVRLMLALGWPVAVPGDWQASALNQAAFRGDAAMVGLLIAHGARADEPNGYGGNALGSCEHAEANEPVAGGDYALVRQLLMASRPASSS